MKLEELKVGQRVRFLIADVEKDGEGQIVKLWPDRPWQVELDEYRLISPDEILEVLP